MKKIIQLILLLVILIVSILVSCNKDEQVRLSKVIIGSSDEITETTAKVGGEVIDVGDYATAYGHCWSIGKTPTLNDNKKDKGGTIQKGKYTSDLTELEPNTEYFVRAYILEGTNVIYSTDEVHFTTLELKEIKITSPASGDNWNIGDTLNITWNANIEGNVKIELFKGGTYTKTISDTEPNDSNYIWILPEEIEIGTGYTIKITAINNVGITAQSTQFQVSEGDYISINKPSEDAIWQKGTVQNIEWTDHNVENVKIELLQAGIKKGDIDINTKSDGEYLWTVSEKLSPDNNYKIKITSVDNASLFDESPYFRITAIEPTVITQAASNITGEGAKLNGVVNANGETVNVSFEWGEPTAYGNTVTATPSSVSGNAVINVSADISGLTIGKTYHFILKAGDTYGEDKEFITASYPEVTTSSVTTYTHNSAVMGGTIINNGGISINGKGVCWDSTSTTPDISGDYISIESGNENFNQNITGLKPSTTYYVRAYAINDVDTSYGNVQTFKTEGMPYISIAQPNKGEELVMGDRYLIKWDDNLEESIQIKLIKGDEEKNLETNISSDISEIEVIIPTDISVTDYSLIVASMNSEVSDAITVYVSEATKTGGSVANYQTIKIGKQWWMSENLKTENYFWYGEGEQVIIGYDPTIIGVYDYDGNADNIIDYGKLYSKEAISKEWICPQGWHVSTNADWDELIMYIGNNVGGHLKATDLWIISNIEATNKFGFNATPAGCKTTKISLPGSITTEIYADKGEKAYFWTSTTGYFPDPNNPFISKLTHMIKILEYNSSRVLDGDGGYYYTTPDNNPCYSVRCVKD